MRVNMLFAMVVLGACTTQELATSQHQQADTDCGPGVLDENGEEIICIDTWKPGDPCATHPELCNPPDPCDLDPNACTPPGGGGGGGDPDPNNFCPSRDKTDTETHWSADRTRAQQGAETAARDNVGLACTGDYYYFPYPSYCGDGDYNGFRITSSSCVFHGSPQNEWECSATAKVTCTYTFHLL